jgi:hypothetical protein
LALFSLSLFGPAFIYQRSPLAEKTPISKEEKTSRMSELVCLQLGGLGVLSLYIAYPKFRDCGDLINGWTLVGGVLVLFGLFAFIKVVLQGATWHERLERSWNCFLIGFMAVTPLLIFVLLLQQFKSSYVDGFLFLMSSWLFVILINSAIATKLEGYKSLAFALVITTYLVVLVSVVSNSPSFLPTMVAEYLGVRGADLQTLRIPSKTCDLISGSLGVDNKSTDLVCTSGDWGQVKAQVLSNVGERWLIEMPLENIQTKHATTLRLTIPRADIQTVSFVGVKTDLTKPAVCKQP